MRYLVLVIIAVASLGATTAIAEDGEYAPIFGKGDHTVWDEEEGDFGNTYEYHASPTDYGWATFVVAEGAHSYEIFGCFYYEEDDRVVMLSRFSAKHGLTFADEEVSAEVVIGEHEAIEVTYRRQSDYPHILDTRVSGFDLSRASEAVEVSIGPFTFEHSIKGLFDVPAAQNLVWCDELAEPEDSE